MADAVRKGGNIGAHFDLAKEPDRESAEALLDLTEYLLRYMYTLPVRIEELNQRITELGAKDEDQPNPPGGADRQVTGKDEVQPATAPAPQPAQAQGAPGQP